MTVKSHKSERPGVNRGQGDVLEEDLRGSMV